MIEVIRIATQDDWVTIKYTAAGVQEWTATFNNPLTNDRDIPVALVKITARASARFM